MSIFKKGEKLVTIARHTKSKLGRSNWKILDLCTYSHCMFFANRQKGEIVVRAIIFFVYLTNLQKHTIIEFYDFFYFVRYVGLSQMKLHYGILGLKKS